MLEIITIGGGRQLIEVLNAVAAWCGGGGFRGLIQVVMVIGLAYALMIMAMNLNWKVLYNWFVTSVLMYSALIVPTTTVIVTDKINPTAGNGAVANVPIGLAAIASFTSQANYWLTTTAETVFNVPGNMTMSGYGMVYPIKLIETSRQYTITDPVLKTNVENYMQDCYFLAVLQNPGTTSASPLSQLIHGNILDSIGPGSPVRFTSYIGTDGYTTNVACNVAYAGLKAALPAWADVTLAKSAKALYPDIADATAALNKLKTDTRLVANSMYGKDMSAQELMLQRSLIDAFNEAQSHLGGSEGDTFAQMRANVQAKNEMSLAARQALIWVPVLELVLTIVFYAMFPLVFPLMLLPGGGVSVLRSYIAGFFYLISWGSVAAVLHLFILYRTSAAMSAGAGGEGFTMATAALLDGMNSDAGALAGYLLMSVPLIAGGLAKGAMSLSHSAGSMLSPVTSAAGAAALERTTGNYGYGNVTANQFNTAPTSVTGAPTFTHVNDNGTRTMTTASGAVVQDNSPGISKLGYSPTTTRGMVSTFSENAAEYHNQGNSFRRSASESYAFATSHANSVISSFTSQSGFEGGKTSSTETGRRIDGGTGERSEESARSAYESGGGHRSSQGVSDRTSTNFRASAAASGSLPLGGGKGGGGGSGSMANLGGRLEMSRSRDTSSVDSNETSTSSSNNAGESKSASTYKVGNDTWTFNQSGVTRNGSFYRYADLGESRNSLEESFRKARTFEEQAALSDDKGFRLDKVAQDVASNGWQLTDDMSQVVASRYNQLAKSPRYASLGAPALSNVDPTPHQASVRNMIVADILSEYRGSDPLGTSAFRENVGNEMQPATPTLNIPTLSQIQASGASLGSAPKPPRRRGGGGVQGADPEGAMEKVGKVKADIKADSDQVASDVREMNSWTNTHNK